MDLQISVFLLFILFTAGHSLNCYQCAGGSCLNQTCPSGFTNCLSATLYANGISEKVKSCATANTCPTGSVNVGIGKVSSYCCSTELCNSKDAPDPPNTPNGKSCYSCDGQNCLNTVSCSGTEDHCVTATGTIGGQSLVVKGCVSKSICDAASFIPGVQGVSCCEGNLCNGAQSVTTSFPQKSTPNGAQSVTQSFLFLCCSLLSYFLLH